MTLRRRIALCLAAAALCAGQEREQTMVALTHEARAITDRAAEEIRSRVEWERVKEKRREELREMLGLSPWPERTPMDLRVTGKLEGPGYSVEKIVYQSLPGFYVTGNLYVPKGLSGPAPAVIYVCGHSGSEDGAKTQYQRHGISLARNGYVAFILDPIQIAEVFGLHHGVYGLGMHDWYSRGYTPAGIEVWNAMRAIDYLETRTDVDKDRIGMTGRSGGAAMSWFTAAVDMRVKVTAPVMGISTYAANVEANTQKLHCDCMFPVNFHKHDLLHLGALIAPRPLLVAVGKQDALFPVPGYLDFRRVISALYDSYGKESEFKLIEVDTGHTDSDFLREEAVKWMDRFLFKKDRALEMEYENHSPKDLRVLGPDEPAGARNALAHEWFVPQKKSGGYKDAAAWSKRRAELEILLRQRLSVAAGASQVKEAGREWQMTAPDGVTVRAVWTRPRGAERVGVIVYVASENEDDAAAARMMNRLHAPDGMGKLIVFPRGVGERWSATEYRDVLRNAMHIGGSVDTLRVRDVAGAIRALMARGDVDASHITVMGRGVAGVTGMYAALLEPRVEHVVLSDAPESHVQGPVVLGVMRETELGEEAGMLSSRRLTFAPRMPAGFAAAREIYTLTGEAVKLREGLRIEW